MAKAVMNEKRNNYALTQCTVFTTSATQSQRRNADLKDCFKDLHLRLWRDTLSWISHQSMETHDLRYSVCGV